MEGALVETAKSQSIPLAYQDDEVLVSLVRVEHGNSNDLTFAVATPISPAATVVSSAIVQRRFDVLPVETQKCLYDLYQHVIKNKWSFEFHASNGVRVEPAVISYEFPVPKPGEPSTTSGSSTLWGNLYKIGGEPPSAKLRMRNGRLVTAFVSQSMIDEIQSEALLYEDIGLIGIATWNLDDWTLQSFKATGLAPYRPGKFGLSETFGQLNEASGGRWEGVDASEFVKQLRSEEP